MPDTMTRTALAYVAAKIHFVKVAYCNDMCDRLSISQISAPVGRSTSRFHQARIQFRPH